ncbi:MAG: TauD/TfdA family dioxygenase [Halioglobus sp.]|nr:TauD/TfdA family dioxygenase [Halioglobus sp.]
MLKFQALPEGKHGFELLHLSPVIGTEVLGIDLAEPTSDKVIRWLRELLVKRKVIFFRDQDISKQQHVDFARRFGDLEVHPFTVNNEDYPEVIHLDNDREHPPFINIWHSDVTWRRNPSLGSVLRAVDVPAVGGDTLFANMEAAYDALDEPTRRQIDKLVAVHDNEGFLLGMKANGASDDAIEEKRKQFPPSTHPVVRTHPESGKKSLYVNAAFTRNIKDMSDRDSQGLLRKLFQTASNPDIQCRFRWRKNSFAFWDNRGAQHYATADYWPLTRKMERVTIVGDRPH